LKRFPIQFLVILFLFAASAFAQQSNGPVAVLVDQIGGRSQPLNSVVRTPPKTQGGVAAAERRAFELMNAERQAGGLPLLEWSGEAAALARMHAQSMADGRFFSHKGLDGQTVDGRASRMGVKWRAIGENIATMKGYEDPASKAVETWLNSTAHKRNMLNGVYNQSAIGAAVASDGTFYFTQVFLSR
jgi:uncharacterized protein YkwD